VHGPTFCQFVTCVGIAVESADRTAYAAALVLPVLHGPERSEERCLSSKSLTNNRAERERSAASDCVLCWAVNSNRMHT